MKKKTRTDIPPETAARCLFLSNRICCVCRMRGKPVQIHHIDGDSNNHSMLNLAVLCLDCHRETQLRGGFDRKLDADQISLFRDDWHRIVSRQHVAAQVPEIAISGSDSFQTELIPQDTLLRREANKGDISNPDLRKEVTEIAVCTSVPDVIYAIIDNSLFVSRDRAVTWSYLSRSAGHIAVDPLDAATVYALQTNGVYVSYDFGENWRRVSKDPSYAPFTRSGQFAVHPTDSNYLLFGSTAGLLISPDRGQTWRHHLPALDTTVQWHFAADHRNGTIVAAGYDKQLHWTQDYGESWFVMASSPTGGTLQPALVQPLVFDPDSGSIWYADLGRRDTTTGPRPNGVFSTYDLGQTWLPAFEAPAGPSITSSLFKARKHLRCTRHHQAKRITPMTRARCGTK